MPKATTRKSKRDQYRVRIQPTGVQQRHGSSNPFELSRGARGKGSPLGWQALLPTRRVYYDDAVSGPITSSSAPTSVTALPAWAPLPKDAEDNDEPEPLLECCPAFNGYQGKVLLQVNKTSGTLAMVFLPLQEFDDFEANRFQGIDVRVRAVYQHWRAHSLPLGKPASFSSHDQLNQVNVSEIEEAFVIGVSGIKPPVIGFVTKPFPQPKKEKRARAPGGSRTRGRTAPPPPPPREVTPDIEVSASPPRSSTPVRQERIFESGYSSSSSNGRSSGVISENDAAVQDSVFGTPGYSTNYTQQAESPLTNLPVSSGPVFAVDTTSTTLAPPVGAPAEGYIVEGLGLDFNQGVAPAAGAPFFDPLLPNLGLGLGPFDPSLAEASSSTSPAETWHPSTGTSGSESSRSPGASEEEAVTPPGVELDFSEWLADAPVALEADPVPTPTTADTAGMAVQQTPRSASCVGADVARPFLVAPQMPFPENSSAYYTPSRNGADFDFESRA